VTKNQNTEKPTVDVERAELAWVDPRTVVLGKNVRSDASETLNPDFVESIRERGILSPPTLVRMPDGALHVKMGQRRTLGAIAADLPLYPVKIETATGNDLDRLTEQFHENDMRAGLNDADRTAGWAEMALFGATAGQIAKWTKAPKKKVEAALGVAASETARAVQVEHNLTIDQAAAIVEFEGDDEAVEKLTRVAVETPAQFAHTAQRLRDTRRNEAAMEAARLALADAGIKEATWADVKGYGSKAKAVGDLRGASGERMTAEEHAACPGRAAQLDQAYGGEVSVIHVCMDPKAYGHKQLSRSKPTNDTRTPEEREAARAERARVIANNKAWKSAEVVRREWLAQFAQRKTAPKGAAAFISAAVLDNGGHVDGIPLAGEWLGVQPEGWGGCRNGIRGMIAKASTGRAQHIGLVVILANMEKNTGTHTWRNAGGKRYLGALQEWGYTLSEVEQIAAGIAPAKSTAGGPEEDILTAEETPAEAPANDAPAEG
jgi:ParB family chromosome partitioning protein